LETVLAAMCVVLAYGWLGTDQWSLPSWLPAPVLLVVAGVLLLAALALGWLSEHPGTAAVRSVAMANGGTALVFLVWAIIGIGAGIELRVLLAVTAILLATLAAMQYARSGAGRRRRPARKPSHGPPPQRGSAPPPA
jgi:hypothetical protein